MKKILIVTFLATTSFCHAQDKQPTRFDKFINQPSIQWAAYASDTFNFDQANLNNILLSRLKNKKIKATLPVISQTIEANTVNYVSYDSIFRNYFRDKNPIIPVMNEQGDVIEYVQEVPAVDTAAFRLTEVTQILYVENGTLKSYVPWVTPTLPVFMSSGKYIGESFFFNTAYSFKHKYKTKKRHSIVFLGQTSRRIKTNSGDHLLKQIYGKGMVEVLWPSFVAGRADLYSPAENRKLDADELNIVLGTHDPVLSPLYSPENAIFKFEPVTRKLKPGDINEVLLVQDWYYNSTKNTAYNIIKEMVMFVEKQDAHNHIVQVPVLTCVFRR